MKKILILTVAMLFVASMAFGASVVNSKHDLSTGSGSGGYKAAGTGQICVFCHTPHSANGTIVPLWNRSTTTAAFTVYSSTTLNATVGQPAGTSLACLSCHDGTLALSSLVNQPNPAASAGSNASGVVSDKIASGSAFLGTDLSNDHPISFVYNAGLVTSDGGLKDPTTLTEVKLFSTKVECASCHNAHDPGSTGAGTAPFLRTTNSASAMCLKCHNK